MSPGPIRFSSSGRSLNLHRPVKLTLISRFRALFSALAGGLGMCAIPPCAAQTAPPLTTLDYRVTGQSLQITPAALAVPKNIAGSVATAVPGELPEGSFVEAFLRGPSF